MPDRQSAQVRPSRHHLAQITIAQLLAPFGDPQVQPFFDALDGIKAAADVAAVDMRPEPRSQDAGHA